MEFLFWMHWIYRLILGVLKSIRLGCPIQVHEMSFHLFSSLCRGLKNSWLVFMNFGGLFLDTLKFLWLKYFLLYFLVGYCWPRIFKNFYRLVLYVAVLLLVSYWLYYSVDSLGFSKTNSYLPPIFFFYIGHELQYYVLLRRNHLKFLH